jgi:hypothetical protein
MQSPAYNREFDQASFKVQFVVEKKNNNNK